MCDVIPISRRLYALETTGRAILANLNSAPSFTEGEKPAQPLVKRHHDFTMLLRNLSLQVEVKEGSALAKALILLHYRARCVCEPPPRPPKPICWPKAAIRYLCIQHSKERGEAKTKKRFRLLQLLDCSSRR